MVQSKSQLREEFDRIALLEDDGWSHNSHYHPFLLRQLPMRMTSALEVGCGTGGFTRRLAERFDHVTGIDLSPRMIEFAKGRSTVLKNIDYQVADILEYPMKPEQFDCIASIATLHHLSLPEILPRLKSSLRQGGILLILDLYRAEGLWQQGTAAAAFPANLLLRLMHRGELRPAAEVRAAWDEHGKTDHYPTTAEVRQVAASLLPHAKVTRHFLWRYSLVWKKA
ncbi:MAG: methyltransferase domain-containing protein [Planctomycetota bacterium]